MITGSEAVDSETIKWRLFVLGVVGPLTALSVGVDGGDIFQMLAVGTLDIDPRAVGAALLLGASSIPVQIWAARIHLSRARHNIRLFALLLGVMALISAAVVATVPPGSGIANLVLVVAVGGELAVSILFATSWQPLISYTLSVEQRQFVNGRGRAVTGLALLGGAVLFGQLDRLGRAAFLAVLGVVIVAVGWSLRVLPPPPQQPRDSATTGDQAGSATTPTPADPATPTDPAGWAEATGSLTDIFLTMPVLTLAGWPLLVSYASVVAWRGGNVGLLAGALALGGMVALTLWRDPGSRIVPLIRVSAVVVAACSVAIVVVGSPDGPGFSPAAVGLLAAAAIGSAGRTVMGTAVMELAHRRIDTTNSVRVMTMMDVVGSTSFQVGAFVAGFLIAASVGGPSTGDSSTVESSTGSSGVEVWGSLDPYQLWLLATAALLLMVAARFRPSSGSRRSG